MRRATNMEFLLDLNYFALYVNNLYPHGIAIEIPTWVIVGAIGLIYSIKLLRK
jgi:uncharacterized membrane protein SpoIIM required for sporulation